MSFHNWGVYFVIGVISIAYWFGLGKVPFHPDEQTQIYMSGDLEQLFSQPTQLFWQPNHHQDLRQRYRELDPPLTRWLIGIGRLIAGLPAPDVDWNWTKDWDGNQASGALPSPMLLLVSRLSVAILFPISLLLMFQIGFSLGGKPIAWLTMLTLAGNALVLLHTRRAMAESALLGTAILTLWAIGQIRHKTYWLAIPAALAFNAKYLNAPLIFVCLLAIFYPLDRNHLSLKSRIFRIIHFLFLLMSVTLILNPFLWSSPWKAVQDAWQLRKELVNEQVIAYSSSNQDFVRDTIPKRAFNLMVNIFINRPAIADVANYIQNTRAAEDIYFSNPFTWFSRGIIAGGLAAILTLYGFIMALWRVKYASPVSSRYLILIWLATIFQMAALIIFNPLPFQRYVMPLIPYICIWLSFGLESVGKLGIFSYQQIISAWYKRTKSID